MARKGVFGRLPRAAPDLTNSIVALVREAQAQQDQNMVDAWKNGGKVEGKGVDDDRLLAHMKMRRDQVSPDDPNWDQWNNNYIQYDFSINESKMALKNDQGKISDAEMAAFYNKWAKRPDVQQDSEFYRSLLSRAAKWGAAAKARSAGNSARAAAEAHQKWADGYYKDHVQGGETANAYLLLIAQTYGAAPPSARSLDDIDPNSVAYGKVLDVIQDGHTDDPNVQGLVNEMTKEIQKTNPNWTWTQGNIDDLLNRGDKGLKRLGHESTSDSERNAWAKRREALRYEQTRIKQVAANDRVQIAADTYATDLDNCAGNPYCARQAMQKLHDKLQAEVPNIVGGMGGVNPMTGKLQDTKTASALINTIEQTGAALAGKPVEPPAAKAAQGGDNAEGYTIFDAAGGRSDPSGWLAKTGNAIQQDTDRLDRGGWMMAEPMVSNGGQAVLDGHGQPMYTYTIYDPSTPQPADTVAVPGLVSFTDPTRAQGGPTSGPNATTGPVSSSPTIYVRPSAPNISYTDATGATVDPKAAGGVHLTDATGKEVAPPWVELRGVKGPDGIARTLYRTGDGTPGNAYLYHEQPPVPATMKPNAAGQYIVPTTVGTDDKNNPVLKADISSYLTGVTATRAKLPSGNFVVGTYSSAGATGVSQAIGNLYHSNDPEAATKADAYLRSFQQGIAKLPDTDPNKMAAMRDLPQLSQTADLYKSGKVGKMLDDAYGAANANDPTKQGYIDQLARSGFTSQKYGQEEVDRRVALLTGIDAADARIAARPAQLNSGGYGGYWGQFTGGLPNADNKGPEQAMLAQQKRDVMNPTISVSSIKVPGMPGMFQPNTAPGQAVNPFAPTWMGQLGQTPGVGMPQTQRPFAPPAAPGGPAAGPNAGPPTFTPPSAPGPATPPRPAPTVAPPPAPYVPPPRSDPGLPPGQSYEDTHGPGRGALKY